MSIWGGIYYPLVTIPVINAVTFSSYKLYKSLFGKDELSALDGFKNGAFAGLMVTFVVTPVELIKCKMQIDQVSKYSSSRACF